MLMDLLWLEIEKALEYLDLMLVVQLGDVVVECGYGVCAKVVVGGSVGC